MDCGDCRTLRKIGCLRNLYVFATIPGQHIAATLCEGTMNWLRIDYVYVSNGNDIVIDFYKKLGFDYSHDAFGGFIVVYYQKSGASSEK